MNTIVMARKSLLTRYIIGWTMATFLWWLSLRPEKIVLVRGDTCTVFSIISLMMAFCLILSFSRSFAY